MRLWRPDGTLLHTLATEYTGGKFLNLGWSPDGTLLAAGAMDYRLWRVDGTPVATFRGYATPARGMAWSPDGRKLAVGDENGVIWLYSGTGEPLATLRGYGSFGNLAFAPDGKTLAVGSNVFVGLVNVEDPRVDPQVVHPSTEADVVWSPDGARLAVVARDNTVHVWHADGAPPTILDGCPGTGHVVAWSPDGKTLAAGSRNQAVCLWK